MWFSRVEKLMALSILSGVVSDIHVTGSGRKNHYVFRVEDKEVHIKTGENIAVSVGESCRLVENIVQGSCMRLR